LKPSRLGVTRPDSKNWGIKPNFETLPAFCQKPGDCSPSGPNYTCQNGVCVDQCLSTPPPCDNDDNCTNWASKLHCPGSAYCNKKSDGGNGYCHYSAPKPNACKKVCHEDSDCAAPSYCNKSPTQKEGCCHDVNPSPSPGPPGPPGPPGSCNSDVKNCEKCDDDDPEETATNRSNHFVTQIYQKKLQTS